VDLSEGDEQTEPLQVGEVQAAPSGHYNAISWKVVKAAAGETAGYSLVLIGTAAKDGETIAFHIKLDQEMKYTAGEFVGEERKGIVQPGEIADLEMTFHFDHLFGDGELPADDELNQGALGFQPFADLARSGELNIDMNGLQERLSAGDYEKLVQTLLSIGHVGEGHARVENLSSP
jgi:hypothetical protein